MSARRARRTGWWAGPLLAAACADAPPSFVLIVVDTLRADRLHFAGYAKPLSPRADALREQSTWFANARATASWTLPSMASLFVSQIGSEHRVVRWAARLPEPALTLAEVLREAGYRTGAWSANLLLEEDAGLAQGFEEYRIVYNFEAWQREWPEALVPSANAEWVTRAALAWLRGVRAADPGAPFFAYLHYMEPHTPYRCPARAAAACAGRAERLNRRLVAREWAFDDRERRQISALYDEEVRAFDAELGRLLDALSAEGWLEGTWVVLTADHGESLGEGDAWLHGRTLERQEIRVPLLLSGPERRAARVDEPVSLMDVAPTLLDLAGVAIPASFRGRSLRAALEGRPLAPAPVVAELFPGGRETPRDRLAVVLGDELLVLRADGALEHFELARDPEQRRPLAATREDLSRMLGALEPIVSAAADGLVPARALSPETRRQLEALGYGP